MSEDITNLELGYNSTYEYKLHPSVPLAILDLYYRRKTAKIAGTLLGVIYPNHIDITNCYAVPLITSEEDEDSTYEIGIDKDYHKKMLELNQKVYPKEVVVGFFITQTDLNFDVTALNSFYLSKESNFIPQGLFQAPIIVTIDPEMGKGGFDIKGFVQIQNALAKDTYIMFQSIDLKLEFLDEEVNEVNAILRDQDVLKHNENTLCFTGIQNLDSILEKTIDNLKCLQNYLRETKENKNKQKIGKNLRKILNLTPVFSQKEFSNQLSKEMQDVLLLMYLTKLANVQGSISEKLNKI